MKKAFSLVELSIVLVILGLLVGGILAGQSLIRASELRAAGTEYQRYQTATSAFRDKYFAIPGDMKNATNFWGQSANCPGDASHIGTGTQTCNGDGNGQLTFGGGTSNEVFRFWQQLASAGLIEGSYDGVTHGSNDYSATAANAPLSKLSGGLWNAFYWGPITGMTGTYAAFDGQYGNNLHLGAITANDGPSTPIFKPTELWNIDTKLDDGKPALGTVVMRGTLANCTDAAATTTLTANYLLSSSNIACAAIFRNVF